MRRRRQGWTICAVVLLVGLLGSSTVLAQNTGSITGRAEDDTGGVLPGVAVTATSPVLIEQSRETVTDGTGRFNITELPPGLYEVRFILGRVFNVRHRSDRFVGRCHGHSQRGDGGRGARGNGDRHRGHAGRRHPERANPRGRWTLVSWRRCPRVRGIQPRSWR